MSAGTVLNRPFLLFIWLILLLLEIPATSGTVLHLKTPDSCMPGALCLINWEIDASGPHNFHHVDFFLMDYSYGQLNLVYPIAFHFDLRLSTSLVWWIPGDDLPEQQYFIAAFAVDIDYKSYSDFFWIMNDFQSPKPPLVV